MKIKKQTYPVETIMPLIGLNPGRVQLDGDWVRVGAVRLQMFKHKGIKCVSCGIEGKFFRKEIETPSSSEAYHLNLYAIGKHKQNVLMTKDHIFPVSKGGQAILENLQPMCQLCNNRKQNTITFFVWLVYNLRECKRFVYSRLLRRRKRKRWNVS